MPLYLISCLAGHIDFKGGMVRMLHECISQLRLTSNAGHMCCAAFNEPFKELHGDLKT